MQQVISGAMLALKLVSAYFLIVALFALKKPKPIPRANPKTRFACVIAARNEERVIGELVQSLLRQNYPKTLFDIYVMPNNCTDHTALAAIRTGAAILKPRGEVRCKGDALHEAFETLLRKDYDAFCVFDADNVVDADFLSRMNDAFLAGAKVTKGAMRVKNPQDSPLCGCYGLYFTCFDFFFSRARMNCGLSSKLVGTGFAVHRSVLEQSGGWNSATIAEDAEFAAYLAETGTRVWFVPEAVTYRRSAGVGAGIAAAETALVERHHGRGAGKSGRAGKKRVCWRRRARAGHASDADAAVLSGGGLFAHLRVCAFADRLEPGIGASAAGASGGLSCHERVCAAAGGNLEAEDCAVRCVPVPAVYGKLAAAESGVAAVQNPGLEGN